MTTDGVSSLGTPIFFFLCTLNAFPLLDAILDIIIIMVMEEWISLSPGCASLFPTESQMADGQELGV